MTNSSKYQLIEHNLDYITEGGSRSLHQDAVSFIIGELMEASSGRENPDTLPSEIRDTYHRLYG